MTTKYKIVNHFVTEVIIEVEAENEHEALNKSHEFTDRMMSDGLQPDEWRPVMADIIKNLRQDKKLDFVRKEQSVAK